MERALLHTLMIEFHEAIFARFLQGGRERGGMMLHDAVGVNCKKDATTQ